MLYLVGRIHECFLALPASAHLAAHQVRCPLPREPTMQEQALCALYSPQDLLLYTAPRTPYLMRYLSGTYPLFLWHLCVISLALALCVFLWQEARHEATHRPPASSHRSGAVRSHSRPPAHTQRRPQQNIFLLASTCVRASPSGCKSGSQLSLRYVFAIRSKNLSRTL